ncbi:tyrosine-type recombinase/integrase [Neobacillus drentensis]|uniref:tyrosine-type recombinase/integrase n=1 Tax=Neobacillus drentensis TaxID=220684 RepID=UPI00300031DB
MMNTDKWIKRFTLDYQFRLDLNTLTLYHLSIKNLLHYIRKEIDTITKHDIRNWLGHLIEKGYQPSTINTKLAGVKLFFKYCLDEKVISKNPAKDILFSKVEGKLPRYLSMEQLTKLRALLEGRLEERAIVEVLYATGIRMSELAAMKKIDINWSERLILIPKGKRKKGRIVLFTRECAEHLKAYLDSRTDDWPFVFALVTSNGKRSKHARVVDQRFLIYSEQLGFKMTPHTLRHTFAAHLAKKGMSLECIQVLLGHDKFETTRVYARLYDHARKEMYDEWM